MWLVCYPHFWEVSQEEQMPMLGKPDSKDTLKPWQLPHHPSIIPTHPPTCTGTIRVQLSMPKTCSSCLEDWMDNDPRISEHYNRHPPPCPIPPHQKKKNLLKNPNIDFFFYSSQIFDHPHSNLGVAHVWETLEAILSGISLKYPTLFFLNIFSRQKPFTSPAPHGRLL